MNFNKSVPYSLRQAAENAIRYEQKEMELLKSDNAKLKREIQRLGCENFINLRVNKTSSRMIYDMIYDVIYILCIVPRTWYIIS